MNSSTNPIRRASRIALCAALALGTSLTGHALAADDAAAKQTIKLATILPDGAPGTTELRGAADAIKKASGDKVELKLYLGVSGDEKDIVKKLKINQLQAAHLTGLGLAEILPSIHVLDLPFFFTSYAEVDHVYENIFAHFQQAFREKGFEFLGFTETGFVYMYSNLKIENLAQLQQAKIWAAEGDPLTAAFVGEAKMQAVPLGIPDVLQSLQTGLIDTVYGPPSGMIGLQWFTKVKYVQTVPFVHATGGVVMSKKAFDALAPELQASLTKTMAEQAKLITQSLRKVNEDSKEEIRKSGVADLPKPSDEFWAQFKDISNRVTENQAGNLYTKELLDKVRKLRDEAPKTAAK
ncbi:MAG: TRAP transporter substrate-binding protein DctP [bacterium]